MDTTRQSRPLDSDPVHPSDRASGRADFDLVRYFSLACLGVFIVVTAVMCTGFYQISKRYIRLDTELRSVRVAEDLAPFVFGMDPPPGTLKYDRRIQRALEPLGILKMTAYDTGGRVLYSNDRDTPIEEIEPLANHLREALSSHVVSKLRTYTMMGKLGDEAVRPGTVVETYVPIPGSSDIGAPVGFLEVHQDVSATYSRLPGVIALIVGASVLAMGTLYGILYWLVRKADGIIRAQTHTIKQGQLDAERYASQLELRVEERTLQLRETLAQQGQDEKMVAMGTLAAGVAHELNTPLGSILGSVQLVLEQCALPAAVMTGGHGAEDATLASQQCQADLERIESEAKRCKDIIRHLVVFSRKSDGDRSWADLTELAEHSVALIEPEARQCDVRVELAVDENTPSLRVNANEIQQVLVNIMNNAIAAMPHGGTLKVRVSQDADSVSIAIADSGTGIDPATLPRIFEPFFTTKDVDEGTGLGLSISYRIVNDHGGNIDVSSTPGQGSTFVVELPVDAAKTLEDKRQPQAAAAGSETGACE